MSFTEPRPWLIGYDITDPKRLQKVHRFLKGHAVDVQYSVFLGVMGQRQLEVVRRGLAELIKAAEDDVRVYPIPERCEAVMLGRQVFPDGVLLAGPELLRVLSHGRRAAHKGDVNDPVPWHWELVE